MKGISINKKRKNATPSATEHPSMYDIAWAAGIFEGEGCSHITPKGSIIVTIGQKDPWLPHKLQRLFGGSITLNKNSGMNHGEMHLWRVCGAKARGFLYTIFSLMSPRRKNQIKIALGLQEKQAC